MNAATSQCDISRLGIRQEKEINLEAERNLFFKMMFSNLNLKKKAVRISSRRGIIGERIGIRLEEAVCGKMEPESDGWDCRRWAS